MHKLEPSSLSGSIPLFSRGKPNEAVLFSLLEGRYPGDVIVDSPNTYQMAFAATAFGWGFFSEGCSATFVADCLARYPSQLICSSEDSQLTFPKSYSRTFERLEFREPLTPAGQPHMADGFEYQAMNHQMLDQCVWKNVVLAATGTSEVFFDHGLGLVLTRGDVIACEAYGLFKTPGLIEIGAITGEHFRNQGLCTLVARELIKRCHALGYATTWTCDLDNLASSAVAKKLGYQIVRPYKFLARGN